MIKKLAIALTASLALLAGCAQYAPREMAENGYHKQKVVYHINDASVAAAALRNIKNHLNAVGDKNADVVVVTHGKGIDFLLEGYQTKDGKSLDDMVQALVNRGVKFDVCNNTLKGRHINKESVNLNAKVVPSGVATVAELESQGYVYVKP